MSKYDAVHMQTATAWAAQSKCKRLKVGALLLLDTGVTSPGFNGHASGGPNEWGDGTTPDPEVVHAEMNAMGKCMEQGLSTRGATLYVTTGPCLECAKLILRGGISRVVYKQEYRSSAGAEYLIKYGVNVERFEGGESGSN